MTTYRAVPSPRELQDHWTVERNTPEEGLIQLPFRGTREEAEEEAARLNALSNAADQRPIVHWIRGAAR